MKYYLRGDTRDLDDILSSYDIDGIITESPIDIELDIPVYHVEDSNIIRENKTVGAKISIHSPEDMTSALSKEIDNNLKLLLIETGDWHIIPLENLIAKFADTDIELITSASTPEELELLNNILELGVDGCLISDNPEYSARELLEVSELRQGESFELLELEVTSIEKIGNGDRVCVDTVSNLRTGEGLLVGSTSAVQVLVQAEVEESGFVNARPFRVNAGVVASYCLNFDKTNYLSELSAGNSVMIVNREGYSRKEFVARVKIERRPLIVLRVAYGKKEYPVILQDAETVKLVTKEGSIGINKLKPGDKILGYPSDKARHFGMEIEETIEEK